MSILLVISGPTAIGKTALSIQLAKHFQTEIISSDSRQFYKEISIGTAKPNESELKEVKHHFINSHSIQEVVDAGTFEKLALQKIEELFLTHPIVIMVGGSGLYTQAVCEGLDDLTFRDDTLRIELGNKTLEELQIQLQKLDPDYYQIVDKNNPQRLMRGIEVSILSGLPYSSFRSSEKKKRNFQILKIALEMDREKLYNRINARVDEMMNEGLLKEAVDNINFKNTYALQTVGYSELYSYLDGKISLEKAIELIKQNTRRFAKRQLTWIRRDKEYHWFKNDEFENIIQLVKEKTIWKINK